MNNEQIDGQWMQIKGKIKEAWGKLTDDDIEQFKGDKDQFFGKIKEHYGIGKEDAENKVKNFESDCGCGSAKGSCSTRS